MGFNSWQDFEEFSKNVKFKNRFVHSQDVSEFLFNIKRTLPNRKRRLPANGQLFRAQLGYEESMVEGQLIIQGHRRERMKPIQFNCTEGRANPKGIAYLYLSGDRDTSLAELRPNLGQYISSAEFRTKRILNLVDCYSVEKHYSYAECVFSPPQSQDEIASAVWSMINNAFTRPVTNHEANSDYVPTQMLAEFFKSEGYDGLCVKSGLGDGYNYILFDLDDAHLVNCTVMETKAVSFKFSQCANPYYYMPNID